MALTPGQQQCVDTFIGPLSVSAGAGSGKTFTLTRRIVNAFESGFVDDIGDVLAITFTSKAAGEIKSRVKGALKAAGFADQALLVDSAWISTIHGACARMLRAHALELGINPTFKVADEATAKTLSDEAFEEVLGAEDDLVSPGGFDELFEEYGARSHGPVRGSSVEDMVRALVSCAQASPEGFSSIVFPPHAEQPYRLVTRIVEASEAAIAAASAQKPGKSRDAYIDRATTARDMAASSLDEGDLSALDAVRLINEFPVPPRNFGSSDYKEQAARYAQEHYEVMMQAGLALAEPRMKELIELARRVSDSYARRKSEAGLLDNDDLLTFTARMFSECPDIAAEYADRFKLIMIDEFQDTDQVQIDMIKRMSGDRLERLCTVGDAQQSIYRFRGADVSVYEHHLETVSEANPAGCIMLSDNFRSHSAVLSFVDRIFSQPSVFGRSFMSLRPSRDERRIRSPYCDSHARIDVQCTVATKGISSEDARRVVAKRIAKRFAELREAGQNAGDMVLLLGAMSHADVFAAEMRAQGLPCVVSGGSIFANAPEVRLVERLAEVIANPQDTEALFEVLSSELFALCADDFIMLSTGLDEERNVPRRRALDKGIRNAAEDKSVSAALAAALDIFENIGKSVGREPVSKIMMDVVLDSGWLARLESAGPEGMARAANVYKAIRMVEDIEAAKPLGAAGVARDFALRLSVAKEAPGALSATSGDFVRIMTIHASKGLEFPIVAIAEVPCDTTRSRKLLSTSFGGKTYVSLAPGASFSALRENSSSLASKSSAYNPLAEDELAEADLESAISGCPNQSAAFARLAISLRESQGERQESKRLLYVAITRAKEAVICAMQGKASKADPTGLSKSAWRDVETALVGEEGYFAEGVSVCDYGGEKPAYVERIDLFPSDIGGASAPGEQKHADGEEQRVANERMAPDEGIEHEGDECAIGDGENEYAARASEALFVDIPKVPSYSERPYTAVKPAREGVFSYSSLASTLPAMQEDDFDSAEDAPFGLQDGASEYADDAALEETFFAAPDGRSEGCEHAFDADRATDFGTAFHRLAQYVVLARVKGGALEPPDDERVFALCRSCGLSLLQQARLRDALDRWLSSDVAREVAGMSDVRAEVPFFVQVGDASDAPFLEGEIDLLACDEHSDRAFVVDYKTGGSLDEGPDYLQKKHRMQAMCYAYAVLLQGYLRADFAFVRVEQPDRAHLDQPQVVRYSFSNDDMAKLEDEILAAYRDSR